MRIGIVTVFKTDNCGSFLQAWALSTWLHRLGHQAFLVSYSKLYESKVFIILQLIKACLKLNFSEAALICKKVYAFVKARRLLTIENKKTRADMYFFGSDTIWNFGDQYFKSMESFFLGCGITKPKYTYAVSIGSTEMSKLLSDGVFREALQRFSGVSVRDGLTRAAVDTIVGEDKAIRAVDPTMLLRQEDYSDFMMECPKQKILFIYYFGVMDEELIRALNSFAKQEKIQIIDMGHPEKRFDGYVENSPEWFITLITQAKYVFTNTYHGCVFSLLFRKQFLTNANNKAKIEDLLDRYCLLHRIIKEPDELIPKYKSEINYSSINGMIENDINQSKRYIEDALIHESIHQNGNNLVRDELC